MPHTLVVGGFNKNTRGSEVVAKLEALTSRLSLADQRLVKRCYSRSTLTSVDHIRLDQNLTDSDI